MVFHFKVYLSDLNLYQFLNHYLQAATLSSWSTNQFMARMIHGTDLDYVVIEYFTQMFVVSISNKLVFAPLLCFLPSHSNNQSVLVFPQLVFTHVPFFVVCNPFTFLFQSRVTTLIAQ